MTDPTENAESAEAWPGVSVVVPVLDEEAHLRAAVSTVLGQDYPGDLEVVLALGPSRDRTDEIAAELAAADDRVRLVPNPTGPPGPGSTWRWPPPGTRSWCASTGTRSSRPTTCGWQWRPCVAPAPTTSVG